jgi:class 3 adenylate cyclase
VLSFPVWESANSLSNLNETKQAIMFTDVKGSSKLWNIHKLGMFKALEKHEIIMDKIIPKHNGEIVKTIGDSYMVSWNKKDALYDAICSGIDIQKSLKENPILIKGTPLTIRIGISFGPLYKKKVNIQGKKLWDFFGNTVNTASRMESMISTAGDLAFSFTNTLDDIQEKKILDLLESKNYKINIIDYQHKCYKGKRKRSGRLLSELQLHTCEPLIKLRGVDKVTAYYVKL